MRTLPSATVALTLVTVVLGSAACTRRVTDFTVISTKNTMLVAEAEKRERRIKGEDCTFTLVGVPNMKEAIDDAIEKAGPGYDALVDGVIYYEDRFLYACYSVEGTPLRAKDAAPAEDEVVAPERTGRRGRTDRGHEFRLRDAPPPPVGPEPPAPVVTPAPRAPAAPPAPAAPTLAPAPDAPAGESVGATEEAPVVTGDDESADETEIVPDDSSDAPYVR